MKPYLCNVILGILTSIIVIIPFTGKVHDGRKRWHKRFTFRGWVVVLVFTASIGVNYYKDLQIDKDEAAKIKTAKKEKEHDDSVSRKLNDESNAKIVTSFTDALAKNGLKYDSAEKVIKKLVRDSAKKVVKIGNEPNLMISAIRLLKSENNVYYFNNTITSQNATSEHIYIKQYIVVEEKKDSLFLIQGPGDFFAKDGSLDNNQPFSYNVNLTSNNPQVFYFLFIGKYKDIDGRKLKMNKIYTYDFKLNAFGFPLEPSYSRVRLFFKHNNIRF